MNTETFHFQENPAIRGREDAFIAVEALVAPVLASWKESLFAHEWLHQDGSIRKPAEMPEPIRIRRKATEESIDQGPLLERPVLGIGIMDNIEIGAGKDLFLTLAARGVQTIPVHIPKSQIKDFRFFVRFP